MFFFPHYATLLLCSDSVEDFGVAVMASPLRIGQAVGGAKDVYVVARKLHESIWSAR